MADLAIFVTLAAASFALSTLFIGGGIPHLRRENALSPRTTDGETERPGSDDGGGTEERPTRPIFDWRSTGLWIGLCEVALVFPLVYYVQFGALAIIFGAKEYVRKGEIQKNPSHYLLGTLVNLSVAVLFALLAKHIVQSRVH